MPKLPPYFLFVCLLASFSLLGQRTDSLGFTRPASPERIHAVNPWVSVPLGLGVGYVVARRADLIRDKGTIDLERIENLDRNDVPAIDRWALDLDIDNRSKGLLLSDYMQNLGQSLPLGLFIWKKYRKRWLDIGLMYFEAQTLQGLIYGYSPWGPGGTDRLRPFTYYDEIDMDRRRVGNEQNSQYSGHVSTTTTGFFFVAKIIDDFNPDLSGGQRALLYTGALIPSVFSGYLRVRALKHFPTDSALGLAMGAFSGVIVPELHRWWAARHRTSLVATPVHGNGATGLALSLRF